MLQDVAMTMLRDVLVPRLETPGFYQRVHRGHVRSHVLYLVMRKSHGAVV